MFLFSIEFTERQTLKVDTPGQWVVHARIGSYNLYTQSFLSVLLNNGWVSDDVSVKTFMLAYYDHSFLILKVITCYFKVTLKQHSLV